MASNNEAYPKEYWVYRLGQQLADLRVRFEDAWNPFYPGDSFELDSAEQLSNLPAVEFYSDLDLEVGKIRKTLEKLTQCEPKVKKVVNKALEMLDGTIYKVDEEVDKTDTEDKFERQKLIRKRLVTALKDGSVALVDNTSVRLPPLILTLMTEVYENHRQQAEIIIDLLQSGAGDQPEVPESYSVVTAEILPIFERPPWSSFEKKLEKVSVAMGEASAVAFEVAKELGLATYYFRISTKIPFASWSSDRQFEYVARRTDAAINKLTQAGFDIDSIEIRREGVLPGTFAEYASAAISQRLKEMNGFCRSIETAPDSSAGVFAHYSAVDWEDVRLTITYENTGQRNLSFGPAKDRELPETSRSAVEWGFAKENDPRSLTKQWHCLLLLAAGNTKAQFVKHGNGQLEVDFGVLPETSKKLFQQLKGELPNTKEAIKKQMKDLGRRLSQMTGIPGSPISLKRKAPENRVLWTIDCPTELILEHPKTDDDNS